MAHEMVENAKKNTMKPIYTEMNKQICVANLDKNEKMHSPNLWMK